MAIRGRGYLEHSWCDLSQAYGTPRLPYNVFILGSFCYGQIFKFVMCKMYFGMHKLVVDLVVGVVTLTTIFLLFLRNQITTKSGSSSAHQQNQQKKHWWAYNDQTLDNGLVALRLYRGSVPVLLVYPIA